MPEQQSAEIVIIGGGAVGCGVAYALAQAGHTDVLVLEKNAELGAETTSQGAGLCGQLRTTLERTRLAMHSAATFRALEQDPDARPDWRPVGSLRLALTERRVEEIARLEMVATEAGLEVRRLTKAEARAMWPPLDWQQVLAVLFCPSDGYMTPASVVQAYAHQCQKRGVRFATDTAVRAIDCSGGRAVAVETDRDRIDCRIVINAAGAHAYHVAKLVGLELPIVPVRHEYFVSVPVPGLDPQMPCFRIPDLALYGRVTGDCLLLGGWEGKSLATDPREFALGEAPPPVEPDQQVLGTFAERFARLYPGARDVPQARIGKGWPTFTPDGQFIIGESSHVRGFVMAGGCNAHGISGSGGIGRLVVESLFDGQPSDYVRSLSPDRFTETKWDWETANRQARRIYETYYGVEQG